MKRYIPPMQEIIKEYDMRAMAIEYKPVRSIEMPEMAYLGCLAQGDLGPLVEKVIKSLESVLMMALRL